MKSVTAAEVAALALWRLFTQGDRVGAVVFDDHEAVDIAPHRSRGRVLRILHAILEKNHALRADAEWPPGPGGLNTALERAGRLATHDHVVGVISDFDGLDDETERLVSGLAQHNDVIAFPIYDPAQTVVPEGGRLVVGDGELQLELDLGRDTVRRGLREFGGRRLARLEPVAGREGRRGAAPQHGGGPRAPDAAPARRPGPAAEAAAVTPAPIPPEALAGLHGDVVPQPVSLFPATPAWLVVAAAVPGGPGLGLAFECSSGAGETATAARPPPSCAASRPGSARRRRGRRRSPSCRSS